VAKAIKAIVDGELARVFSRGAKSPIVIFALISAVVAAIGAPLFALSDKLN